MTNASRGLVYLSAISLGILFHAAADELREVVNFNREWKFQLGDIPRAAETEFDDTNWNDANLPHSFSN